MSLLQILLPELIYTIDLGVAEINKNFFISFCRCITNSSSMCLLTGIGQLQTAKFFCDIPFANAFHFALGMYL